MLNTKKIISAIKLDRELLSPKEQEEAAIILCHALRTYRDPEPCATRCGSLPLPGQDAKIGTITVIDYDTPSETEPKNIKDFKRLEELRRAVIRLIAVYDTIPLDLIEEHNDLNTKLIHTHHFEIKDNGR